MTNETEEKVTPKTAKGPSKADEIADLSARVEKLERNQRVIRDAFEFAANEVRPIYGMGILAVIFDAIHKQLKD